jgi:hypothetical protein
MVGLIPILAFPALGLGLIAVVLGFMSWRAGRAHHRTQGRAGMILGVIAMVLGIIGYVIVANAFKDFNNSLDGDASGPPPAALVVEQ